jgi:ABC-type nitrate/sulfonate/bicarbonate transport system permease component
MTAAVLDIAMTGKRARSRQVGGLRDTAIVVGMVAFVPVAWWAVAATGVLGPGFIGPGEAVKALIEQWDIVWYNALPTVSAAVTGALILVAMMAVGLFVAGVLSSVTPWFVALSVVVGSVPLISLTPALSLFFSRGTALITTVVVLAGLVPVAATLAACARVSQQGYEELGALYEAGRLTWWTNVGFWRSIPSIGVGLRTMLPACFVGAIVAEWSGAAGERGLGSLMANALFSYQIDLLWATLMLAAVVSLVLMAVVSLLMAPLERAVR